MHRLVERPDVEGLDSDLEELLLSATDAAEVRGVDVVQSLWGGYGQILRCAVAGGAAPRAIVKHVRFPMERDHPYGWTSDRSHERKVESYRVETAWYEQYAQSCEPSSRVPRCLAVDTRPNGVVIVLEDLDASGFAGRRQPGSLDLHRMTEIEACLTWLAGFHATFMGERPDGLWHTGTYWHLATRPDELDALEDGPLKAAAGQIDQCLSESPFQTFVHGDAKLANFCFDAGGGRAAAVDFQYVGGGCGMKDVAYFISSCLDEAESEVLASGLLDRYFELLRDALQRTGNPVDADLLEEDWRALYPVAWTDFYRFLQGWSPGHWKLHRYSERLAAEVLDSLDSGR